MRPICHSVQGGRAYCNAWRKHLRKGLPLLFAQVTILAEQKYPGAESHTRPRSQEGKVGELHYTDYHKIIINQQ